MAQRKLIDGKYEYFAFISYRDEGEDAEMARWLQKKLEHFKLPTFIRKDKPELPERISPIFEYKSETGNTPTVNEAIWKGLTSSKYLIVICSPRAMGREWLNKGIRYFVESGFEKNIIPFIIDGKPKANNSEEECFPEELLRLKDDRELQGININVDGRDKAAVKVISRMFDIKFDTLWQRYEREQRRKKYWMIAMAIIAFLCITVVAFWMYWQNLQTQNANWKMMENKARAVAEKARLLIAEGNPFMAQRLAIEVLPYEGDGNSEKPYIPEAEAALREAFNYEIIIYQPHSIEGPDVLMSGYLKFDNNNEWIAFDDRSHLILFNLLNGVSHTVLYNTPNLGMFSFDSKKFFFSYYDFYEDVENFAYVDVTNDSIHVFYTAERDNDIKMLLSDTGKYLLLESNRNELQIYEITPTLKLCSSNVLIDSFTYTQFPRKNYITSDSIIALWAKRNNAEIPSLDKKWESPDYIVTLLEEKNIVLWDKKKGFPIDTLYGHLDLIQDIAFSPLSNLLASISYDNTIRIWCAENGSCIKQYNKIPEEGSKIMFSPNGRWITVLSDWCGFYLLSVFTPSQDKTLTGHTFHVQSSCFSPNNNYIVSGSRDNTIKIWNAKTGECTQTIKFDEEIEDVSIAPNGKIIASISLGGKIHVYDIEKNTMVFSIQNNGGSSISFSPDGKYIVSGGENIIMWDAINGKFIRKMEKKIMDDMYTGEYDFRAISFSKDGKKIIGSQRGFGTVIWDYSHNLISWVHGGGQYNSCSSISPDGKNIVFADEDFNVGIYEIEKDSLIKVIKGHNGIVRCVAYSPNGKYIASGADDGTVKIWHSETGYLIYTFEGHKGSVNRISFNPDGNKIVSASDDKTICIWNFPPLQELIDDACERFKNRQLTPEERRKYYLE